MKNKHLSYLNFVRSILSLGLLALLFALNAPVASAQAVRHQSDFNHMSTGFPLTGSHVRVECETCHTGGIFKGTPKDCAGCHSVGRRVIAPAKPSNHMDTSAPCDTCHTNTVTFTGARFNHMGVQPKACMSCHTGIHAPGKPSGHVVTMSSCDSCHRTSSWIPAGFNHTGTFLICSSCHNGSNAKGTPPLHVPIPAGAECDTCHKSGFVTFAGAIYSHPGVIPTTCYSCHNAGTYGAKTKPAGHIPTGTESCDSCHVGTGYVSFAGSTMNHNAAAVGGTGATCYNCHNGSYTSQGAFLGGAKAKTPNHVVSANTCYDCHTSFNTFAGAAKDHTALDANKCRNCHNGSQALGPTNSVSHTSSPGNAASCETCHGSGYITLEPPILTFAGASFLHTGVTPGTCGTCHLGQSAVVKTKGSGHIPTVGNACNDCHSGYASGDFLTSANMNNHNSISVTSTSCSTCHGGAYTSQGRLLGGARAKTPTHLATSSSCNTCHYSFTTFTGAVFNHAGVTPTTCGSCHLTGLGGALTKSARPNHIPTVSNACDACHKAGYTTFAGATMNHLAVTTMTCTTCHSGVYTSENAWDKTHNGINHVPTSLDCKTCHIGTASWAHPPEKMDHVTNGNTVNCTACHSIGASYSGSMTKKPLGPGTSPSEHRNAAVNANCSNSGCHRPLGSKGSLYSTWN